MKYFLFQEFIPLANEFNSRRCCYGDGKGYTKDIFYDGKLKKKVIYNYQCDNHELDCPSQSGFCNQSEIKTECPATCGECSGMC